MKSTKTEYQGVVFDSKSEAIFARAMDLDSCRWLYHPKPHNGHEWDFIVQPFPSFGSHELRVGDNFYSYLEYTPQPLILVEYKPKRPTDTYILNLQESLVGSPIDGMIVYGDPFSGEEYTEIVFGSRRNSRNKILRIYNIQQAMAYRFDLKHTEEPRGIVEISLADHIAHLARHNEMSERLAEFMAMAEVKQNGG
tara:strand:+ start:262 stop:846 length:585 start_codon:yes stop_codon:yes gene_type:complete